MACRYVSERSDVPVYAPPGVRDLLRIGPDRRRSSHWHDVADGDRIDDRADGADLLRTDHPPETLAVRVDAGGRSLGYSADSGPGLVARRRSAPASTSRCARPRSCRTGRGILPHMSARQAGATARAAGGRAPADHPSVAHHRAGRRPGRGGRGLRAARCEVGRRSTGMTYRGRMRRDGRQPDELRPVSFVRDYTEFATGLGAGLDGPDQGAVHGVGRRPTCPAGCAAPARGGSPPSTRCCRGRARADRPGGGPGPPVGPDPGDPAADRAGAAGGDRPAGHGGGPDHPRLRRPAGRRGTRTASICGAYVALHDAFTRLVAAKAIPTHPLTEACAAVSVGVVGRRRPARPRLLRGQPGRGGHERGHDVVEPIRGGPGHRRGHGVHPGRARRLLGLAEHGIGRDPRPLQAEVLAAPPPARPPR